MTEEKINEIYYGIFQRLYENKEYDNALALLSAVPSIKPYLTKDQYQKMCNIDEEKPSAEESAVITSPRFIKPRFNFFAVLKKKLEDKIK